MHDRIWRRLTKRELFDRRVRSCAPPWTLSRRYPSQAKGKGRDWTRNDRLLAVATHAQAHQALKDLSDLRPHLLEEIKEFFVDYNKLRNRKFKADGETGPRKACLSKP